MTIIEMASTMIPLNNTDTTTNITLNSSAFETNPFIIDLTKSFHVINKPLAVFLFICVCIACLFFIIIILLCIRTCIRRKYVPKVLHKRPKGIYVDEIPGLAHNIEQYKYGSFEYSLEYNIDHKQLKIGVLQANNLIGPISSDTLDPYSTITLAKLDGNNNLRIIGKQERTNIISNTNRPVWKKIFTYDVEEYDLNHVVIIFEVFAHDNICQDISIGKLEVYLKDIDHGEYAGNIIERTGWLTAGTSYKFGLGELCIGIGYYPNNNLPHIDVYIYECRQLNLDDYLPKSKQHELDILIILKQKKRILYRQKTYKRKELINPYFNQKISIPLRNIDHTTHNTTYNQIEKYHIICQLRHINRLYMKQIIGTIHIGLDSSQTTGIKQWEEIIKNPSKIHVMWHSIVPS
ncbi:synaptotagmin, putative [Schistosoma mansoni]|uniref:synaptotagmin, putative n=1 Tax=Schistosoma mansoni TaxID=6183 RepID=UPI0001A61F52|nr:synaptotagmin, putative [Schistosoma mansoni]|eukprot:XP_018646730.1 synaptotagmin, putative [Schistosoma mansoni]